MPYIIGIDPSLASTGLAIFKPEKRVIHYCCQIDGHVGKHPGDRCEQIAQHAISSFSCHIYDETETDITLIIEEPSGQLQGYAQDLRTLYWAIIRHMEGECEDTGDNIVIYPVAPNTLKKFLSGRGNCSPEDKALAVITKYKQYIQDEYVVSSDTKGGLMKYKDLYDAIGLALLGDCLLGGEGYTKLQHEALNKVAKL
jgi:hypothetical protein